MSEFRGSVQIRANPVTAWEQYDVTLRGDQLVGFSPVDRSGGYWEASFAIVNADLAFLTELAVNGLGREVVAFLEDGRGCWEGYIDSLELSVAEPPSIRVGAKGWVHTLAWRVYNQTANTGTQGVSAEVAEIVGAYPLSSLLTGLVSWWTLNEGSGSATDSGPSGNTLAATAAPVGTYGKVGYCRQFVSASSQYLSLADGSVVGLDFNGNVDFTISCWVKLSTVGALQRIVGKWNISSNRQYIVQITSANQATFQVSSGGISYSAEAQESGVTFAADEWHHIVAWHDATADVIGISVDGKAPTTTSYSSGLYNGTAAFAIGCAFNGAAVDNPLDGYVDEVGVWSRVLTATERGLLHNGGVGITYADLALKSGVVSPGVGQFVREMRLAANPTPISRVMDQDRRADTLLDDLVKMGDQAANRYVRYMTDDRVFVYDLAAAITRT